MVNWLIKIFKKYINPSLGENSLHNHDSISSISDDDFKICFIFKVFKL